MAGQPLKPSTAFNRFESLQQFFRWCVKEDEIEQSPMERMKVPTKRAATTAAVQTAVTAYPNELTKREVEVLRLVAEGLTKGQVAARLFLSPHTVHAHLTSIYRKIGSTTRTAAVRFALQHNLVFFPSSPDYPSRLPNSLES